MLCHCSIQDHHIAMRGIRVDYILSTVDVICCVMNPENSMLVDMIMLEEYQTHSHLNLIGTNALMA